MKGSPRALACRITAAAFLGAGAFLLVAVWLRVINPALGIYEEEHGLAWYLAGTCVALVLLMIAWCFNIKGMRLCGDIK